MKHTINDRGVVGHAEEGLIGTDGMVCSNIVPLSSAKTCLINRKHTTLHNVDEEGDFCPVVQAEDDELSKYETQAEQRAALNNRMGLIIYLNLFWGTSFISRAHRRTNERPRLARTSM